MTMRPLSLLAAVAGTLLAQSADVSAILKRAVTEQESGDLRAAIRDYKEVLRARPHLTQARTNMAAALAQSGRMDEAVDAYRAALNERSSDLEIRTNLALALYTKGDSAAAAVEFQKVQESRATDEKVGALLAGCYVQLKDYEKALAALDRPVKAHPSSPDLLYLKGMALIRSGHPQDGVVFVERVAKTTGSADAFLLAGVTQMTMGQLGPARENLDEAVKRNPALPGALSGLASRAIGPATRTERNRRFNRHSLPTRTISRRTYTWAPSCTGSTSIRQLSHTWSERSGQSRKRQWRNMRQL